MTEDDAEERYLILQIEAIKLAYELESKPYVDMLVKLRSLRPMPSIIIPYLEPSKQLIDLIKATEPVIAQSAQEGLATD